MPSVLASPAFDREQAIVDHLPQVRLIAFKIHRRLPRQVELEDLISAATIGLIQAVDRFRLDHGCKLKTLAEHRIRGAILDYLRQIDPLPRSFRQIIKRRDALAPLLESQLGRPPEAAEIARAIEISLPLYIRCERANVASQTLSLTTLEEFAIRRSRKSAIQR
jgi:RNA polymerase sigma factor FliA